MTLSISSSKLISPAPLCRFIPTTKSTYQQQKPRSVPLRRHIMSAASVNSTPFKWSRLWNCSELYTVVEKRSVVGAHSGDNNVTSSCVLTTITTISSSSFSFCAPTEDNKITHKSCERFRFLNSQAPFTDDDFSASASSSSSSCHHFLSHCPAMNIYVTWG